jgi:RimJ/RimL family protein N-acetyltransferase
MIVVDCPFPLSNLPIVWTWLQDSASPLLTDQGSQSATEFVQKWATRRAVTWAVYRDDELGGWIAYEPQNELTGTAHAVFKKSFRGQGITLAAINLVAQQVFSEGIIRVQMMVREDNLAVQGLIERLGGEKEALWYKTYSDDGQVVTDNGKTVRMIQYGLYRENWYAKANENRTDLGAVTDGGSDSRSSQQSA